MQQAGLLSAEEGIPRFLIVMIVRGKIE